MLSLVAPFFSLAVIPFVVGAPVQISSRAVSSDLLARLNLFEQYSAAAYCPSNNDAAAGASITCSTGNCPLVEEAGAVAVYEFENSLVTDVTGFVARDDTNGLIVVAFRGSESIKNWLADLDFPLVDATDICSDCQAEQGFYDSWEEAKSGVVAAVESAAASSPDYEIVATGHSLGAAIATLCAANIRNLGYTVGLFTYGSPAVGDKTFATYVSDQGGESYRVTHTDDPVPKLPSLLLGYVHVEGEYWITSGNDVTVTASDIDVFTGYDDLEGNGATLTDDVDAHLWYFNHISECYTDPDLELG